MRYASDGAEGSDGSGRSGYSVGTEPVASAGTAASTAIAGSTGTTASADACSGPDSSRLMIAAAGWVLWRARIELVVVWLLLCVVLVIKAHVEQHRLLDAFGDDYRAYAERTPLLLFARGIR